MEQTELFSASSSNQRLTAQAAFEASSAPNGWQQLYALLKNIKVRSRDMTQTAASSSHMEVSALPYLSVNTCPSAAVCTFFGYTGIPPSDPIVAELSSFFAASEPQPIVPTHFATEIAMNTVYDQSPRTFVVGVVFCNKYFKSRFLTAQAYVERAAINTNHGKATSDADRSFISYARFVGLGATSSTLNAFYIIVTFQTVWLGVLNILVAEKKKKIRAGMSMMGLDSNAYLISIWLIQNVQNIATCAMMVAILFVGQIVTPSNVLIVYLLLGLFSFNATAFGTMASVLVPNPKKTNQASLLLLTVDVGEYAVSAYVLGGSPDPTTETLFVLLPSVALRRCISHISTSEFAAGGITLTNLGAGPCGRAILMLLVDCVIYYFLAWYLDAVFPGELGEYHHDRHTSSSAKQMHLRPSSPDIELSDMFEQLDISHIPEKDCGVMRVAGLRNIPLLGLFFRAFYPPSIARKTGPFAGRDSSEAVAGLDLEVHRNEILGFLGHNGADKTTALSIIMGMINPTAGSVIVNGHLLPGSEGVYQRDMDLRTLREVQKTMGICPQQDILFETLTAWETVHLYAAIKGVKVLGRKDHSTKSTDPEGPKTFLDEYLRHLLQDVYLHEKRHDQVKTFSGGMKRKLSVALAFLDDPRVVLLDEPTTGMDVFTRKQVWQPMQQSKIVRSILLTTHSMEEADALGDRLAILSQGQAADPGQFTLLEEQVWSRLSAEYREAARHIGAVLFDGCPSFKAFARWQ
ncbi:hypothetical protein BGZ82_003953 [Podila clonocystis]|nr:hypothetical protein BGZ82_003953 [Podila clonocystis]